MRSYEIILPCILEFFYRSAKKVFAEITARNNLDFGYTAGAVNGADAYEKNAFQQKCYINFLWLYHFLFLPEHNAMQEEEALRGDYSFRINYTIFSTVFKAREKVNIVITTGFAGGYDCVILRIHPIHRNRLFRGLFARALPLPLRADCAAWHPP